MHFFPSVSYPCFPVPASTEHYWIFTRQFWSRPYQIWHTVLSAHFIIIIVISWWRVFKGNCGSAIALWESKLNVKNVAIYKATKTCEGKCFLDDHTMCCYPGNIFTLDHRCNKCWNLIGWWQVSEYIYIATSVDISPQDFINNISLQPW